VAGSTCFVDAVAGMSPEEFQRWLVASCARHGVPLKISDTAVSGRVALLLQGREVRAHTQWGPDTRRASEPPDDIDTGGVEPAPRRAGGDLDAVDNGFDYGVLAGEVELPPLSA
jgi:hypothetical protein